MNLRIITSMLIVLFAISACSENSDISAPSDSNGPMTAAVQLGNLSLDLEQSTLIDEMFFMEEDLDLLLDPAEQNVFDSMLDDRGGRIDRRAGIDMAAIIYYQLIVKANPDLSERILAQVRDLIAKSNETRRRILTSGKTREEILRLLQAEHDRLMREINALIGRQAVANVEQLKQRLEEERDARRQEWQTARIDRLVEAMTKALELTEAEADAVKRILLLQYTEIAKLREQFKDNPEGFREALRQLQARIQEMMREALGEKWEKWLELQRKRDIKPVDRDPDFDAMIKKYTELLGLTEAQATGLKEILIFQHREMQRLMQELGNDREALARALEALKNQVNEKIAALLTPEQYERWKALHGDRKGGGKGGTGTGGRG